jgi:hypothetical protein
MMIKTPTRVVVHVEALGAVGFSRPAKNRCGGKRGRVQELEDPFGQTTSPGRGHI